MNNPPTAAVITATAPAATLANFLKFSPPGQFISLSEEQVELLDSAIDDAYLNEVANQRPK